MAAHGIITQPPVDPHRHLKAMQEGGVWIAFDERHALVTSPGTGSVITASVFEHTVALMDAARRRLGDGFATALALLHQAAHQYVRHQFASAHLLGWTLTEQILHARWQEYQDDAGAATTISRARRKQLKGRDFTASVISQILSLSGRIDDGRLAALDAARKGRHNFAHELRPIDHSMAEKVLTTAAQMLSELLEVQVAAQLSNTFWL